MWICLWCAFKKLFGDVSKLQLRCLWLYQIFIWCAFCTCEILKLLNRLYTYWQSKSAFRVQRFFLPTLRFLTEEKSEIWDSKDFTLSEDNWQWYYCCVEDHHVKMDFFRYIYYTTLNVFILVQLKYFFNTSEGQYYGIQTHYATFSNLSGTFFRLLKTPK